MAPLKLLLLLEGRLGHAHQVEGVAMALATRTEVSVERIPVRPAWWARRDFRPLLTRTWKGRPGTLARVLYGIDVNAFSRPDLIVASGSKTTALALMLRRHFGAKLAWSGLAEPESVDDIDLQLVKSPRFKFDPRTAQCMPPTIVDPASLRLPRPISHAADLNGAEIALLIGGDSTTHRYSQRDWDGLAELVRSIAGTFGVKWRVSNSHRTPQPISAQMRLLLAAGEIAEFVDVATAGPGSLTPLLGADLIVVTEDSSSMLSEASAARRPVVALKPARAKPSLGNEMVSALAAAGEVAVLPMQGSTAEIFAEAVCGLRVSDVDPRAHLAKEILSRLFPERSANDSAR